MARYNIYYNDNQCIAVTRYAGKNVRAVAKCDPADVFNGVYGERLATARCEVKVAEKRQRRAVELANAAIEELIAQQKKLDKLMAFVHQTTAELAEAEATLKAVLDESKA